MYHVVSTGAISLLLYLISFILYKTGFIPRDLHRKTWNTILALTFFLTVVAGLFLALQVSYKWDIPYIKTILRYHVGTGIGLAFAGIFHFSWHFRYYFGRSDMAAVRPGVCHEGAYANRRTGENLFFIGFISTAVQIILLREVLNISGGSEIVGGTYLGIWLLASAAGTVSEKYANMVTSVKVNMLFALGLLLTFIFIILLNIILLSPGESPSFFETIIYLLVALFPFCFACGYSFSRLLKINLKVNETSAGRSFSIETAGGILAGITVSLLLSGFINNYTLLVLLLLISTGYALLRDGIIKGRTGIFVSLFLAGLTLLTVLLHADVFFRGLLLRGTDIISTRDKPYGNITAGKYGEDTSIYYNHRLVRWTGNETEAEEYVHYAMLQHPDPQRVLLISGDAVASAREVKKYGIGSVTYIERDRELMNLSLKRGMTGLNAVTEDAYRFVRNTTDEFDVIISQLPPPSTLIINRFYTLSFFKSLKGILTGGGIFIFSPGVSEDYINRESLLLYSSIFNSASEVFDNIIPIRGQRLYFIASDSSLSTSVAKLATDRNIENLYVNSSYLADDLIKRKSDEILSLIDRSVALNRIDNPSAVFYSQSMNILRFPGESLPSLILACMILVFPLAGVRRWSLPVYFSTAALASAEIIMLFVIQSTIGAMYQLSGLIIASVMAGLASGSAFRSGSRIVNTVSLYAGLLTLFYFVFAILSDDLLEISNPVIILPLIMVASFIPAFMTGNIFRIIAGEREFPLVYASDLAGSSLGFLLISGFILPLIGLKFTVFVLSGMIFTGFLFGTISRK